MKTNFLSNLFQIRRRSNLLPCPFYGVTSAFANTPACKTVPMLLLIRNVAVSLLWLTTLLFLVPGPDWILDSMAQWILIRIQTGPKLSPREGKNK
jgi:hypothetical protein